MKLSPAPLFLLWLLAAWGSPAVAAPGSNLHVSSLELVSGEGEAQLLERTDTALRDLISRTLREHPQLQATFHEFRATLQEAEVVGRRPDPQFTFGIFIDAVETRVGPQESRIGLSQMFPRPAKLRLRKRQALERAEALWEKLFALRWRLIHDLRKLWLERGYFLQAAAITRENIGLIERLLEIVETRFAVGETAQEDLLRLQMDRARLEERLRDLQDQARAHETRLALLARMPPGSPVPVPGKPDRTPIELDPQVIAGLVRQGNFELRALGDQVEAAEHGVRLSRQDGYPDLTVGLERIQTDESPMNVRGNGKDPLILALSMNLPVDRRRLRAATDRAQETRSARVSDREAREIEILAQLETALYQLREARRKIDLYRSSLIPRADQTYEVVKNAYTTGAASFLDVTQILQQRLEFRITLQRAIVDHELALSEIEMLAGRSLRP